jgi:VIT1/CCC1 family predicted Fe2+/Mn2+ transporter
MAKDALGAQASDALAISQVTPARPILAAAASAASFAIGVAMPPSALVAGVSIASTLFLAPAGGDRRAGGPGPQSAGRPSV